MKAKEIRPGNVIVMNNELFRVLESVHKTPGNLRAFIQVKMVKVKDGTQREHRFASTEDVEKAMIDARSMQYLYKDAAGYHFMNTENYEQIALSAEQLGSNANYLLPESILNVTFYEENPIGIELPQSMEFKVIEADPGARAATASPSFKTAKIETGLTIMVPQFVNVGDVIRINTESNEYLERAKK